LTAAITKLEVHGISLYDLEAVTEDIQIWKKVTPEEVRRK
jgi:hypothetical protein